MRGFSAHRGDGSGSAIGKSIIGLGKRLGLSGGMAAEAQGPAPGMDDDAPGEVHQVLEYRLESAALLGAPRAFFVHQAHLTHSAQNVVGQAGAVHDQSIGGELARRQPLQVQIALEFGMVLLAQDVTLVELDHLFLGYGEIGPPALNLNIGNEPRGAITLKVALGGSQHPAQRDGVLFVFLIRIGTLDDFRHDGDTAILILFHQLALGEDCGGPGRNISPPRVPLDDEVDFFFPQGHQGVDGIMGAVQPHQKGNLGQLSALADRPQHKGDEPLLSMLGAWALLDLQTPALQTQPGGDGRIAVETPVSIGDALFLGVGVILGENIQIQRHVSRGQWRQGGLRFFEKLGRAEINDACDRVGDLVEPLAQGFRGRHLLYAQGCGKELVILPERADCLEVALALAQKPQIAAQHIGGGDSTAGRGLGHARGEGGKAINGQSDQGNAGVRGVEFRVGLLYGEPGKPHEKSPWVSFEAVR